MFRRLPFRVALYLIVMLVTRMAAEDLESVLTVSSTEISLNVSLTREALHDYTDDYLIVSGNTSMAQQNCSTYCLLQGLNPASGYWIRVENSTGSVILEGIFYTKPKKTSNLSLVNRTTSSLHINWTAPKDVDYYVVTWSKGRSTTDEVNVNSTNYEITGLNAGHTYSVTVRSVSNGEQSEGVSEDFTTIPNRPASLKVVHTTTTSLQIKWTGSQDIGYYVVTWSKGRSTTDEVNVNSTNYEITGLNAGHTYSVTVRSVSNGVRSEGVSEDFTTRRAFPVKIVAGTLGAILILIIIIIVTVVLYCRRRMERTKQKKCTTLIKLEEFQSRFGQRRDVDICKLSVEFEHFKIIDMNKSAKDGMLPCNQSKNRHLGIIPLGSNRVKLLSTETESGSDYINASWMPGYNSNREYIVTQCPLVNTQDDFWRMVWEQNCQVIVMLNRNVEDDSEMCSQYWPHDYEPMSYGDIEVKVLKQVQETEYIITFMSLYQGNELKLVTHFQYLAWPTAGVPRGDGSFNNFVKIVRQKLDFGRPTVVHCSLGIGRSGVFIVLDWVLQAIKQHDEIDIFAIVKTLWSARPYIIQTTKQYLFIFSSVTLELKTNHYAESSDSLVESQNADANT